MNSEFSPTPREELEAQITALLLGELPENEAAALREKIAADPELRKLHTQIGMTIGLVKEAIASPEPAELAAPEGLKLSGEKREKLLASFKVVKAPKVAREPIRIDFKSWGALAAMIVGLLAVAQWMIGSFFMKARTSAQKTRSLEILSDEPVAQTAIVDEKLKPNVQFLAEGAKGKDVKEEINLGARFHREVEMVKRDGGSNVRIELPSVDSDSESRGRRGTDLGDLNASAGQAAGPAPDRFYSFGGAGGGGTSAGRAFYDGSGSQQSAAGLQIIPTDPAPASTALSFGLAVPSAADLLAVEAKDVWSFDTAGKPIQNLNVIAGDDFGTGRLDAGVQVPKQEMEVTRGFSQDSRGEGLVVLHDFDASKRSGQKAGEENKPAEVRLGLSSVEAVDKLQQIRRPSLNGAGAAEGLNQEAIPTVNELQGVPTLIQNGQLIEAEKLLKQAASKNPNSKAVEYWFRTIDGERATEEVKKRIISDRKEVAQIDEADQKLAEAKAQLKKLAEVSNSQPAAEKPLVNAAIPQPEVSTAANPFSTFSLNVSDVSFKLAAASLEKGVMPEAASIRSEEFINAFDYRDPAAVSAPVAFAWERARYPFAHDRELLRFSVKTAASGREAGKPLNLVLLLDASGSMERSDRVRIIQECLRVLATQLQAQDRVSVVTFARTPRLWVDGLPGSAAGELVSRVGTVTPEGGTNLEEAMRVGYETAARHFATNGVNRVVLLTDGAANLGDVKPESLKKHVEENRKKGIALDCFGIGWEGLNDDLLEQLSRNGDGRYGFVNTPEAATTDFAQQLAGALKVAASDVKVQVEFNPKRAAAYRQIGYAKHQLTKEQFRDNTVDAAEIGAAEAGNALYVVQVNPAGEGPIATVRARFKIPGTNDYREHEWAVAYEGAAKALEEAEPSIRLAGAASAFSEWLGASPYAGEVTPDRLLGLMANIPAAFSNDSRPTQLEWMIRQAKSIAGK